MVGWAPLSLFANSLSGVSFYSCLERSETYGIECRSMGCKVSGDLERIKYMFRCMVRTCCHLGSVLDDVYVKGEMDSLQFATRLKAVKIVAHRLAEIIWPHASRTLVHSHAQLQRQT